MKKMNVFGILCLGFSCIGFAQEQNPSIVSNDFDLRLLDLNTVESIEIIKGAASTLYGNAAATAVINITTKKSSKKEISASFLYAFEIAAYASLDKFKTDIDGFPPPTFAFSDTDDTYVSEQQRVGIAPKYTYKNGSFQINAAYTRIDRETVSAFSSIHEADSYVIDAFNKYVFDERFYTIVGLNYGDYQSVFATEESFTNTDPYLNVVYVSDFGLNLNAGGRLNNHSTYGSQFVYNINPSFNMAVNDGYAKVFGSYATSFIAPNLSQLFGFFGANPDLEPEENITIEAGLEFNTKKGFRVNGVYFNRNEENTIIFASNYENATTDATVHGFELETQLDIVNNLSIAANYTFTEVKDGLRLRVPKHKAR